MSAKAKHKNRAQPRHTRPAPRVGVSRHRFLMLGIGMLLTFAGTWAILEFVVWNTLPRELVGKWVVTDGPQEGATFDFYRSGKMVGHINQGGRLAIVDAVVRVEDNKIYSTTRHSQSGEELTTVQTIRTLTSRDLVVEDQQGNRTRMERAE